MGKPLLIRKFKYLRTAANLVGILVGEVPSVASALPSRAAAFMGGAEVWDGMRMVAGVGGGVGSSRCEGSAPTVGRAGRMLRGSRTDWHVRPCEHQQGRRRGG